jgi:hypothetical protein
MTNDRIRVHWNVHKQMWTVQRYWKHVGWRLYAWRHAVLLSHVKLIEIESEAGRQRALETGVNSVHAFISGILVADDIAAALEHSDEFGFKVGELWYNPQQGFYDKRTKLQYPSNAVFDTALITYKKVEVFNATKTP